VKVEKFLNVTQHCVVAVATCLVKRGTNAHQPLLKMLLLLMMTAFPRAPTAVQAVAT
jgi:hypothetical protein